MSAKQAAEGDGEFYIRYTLSEIRERAPKREPASHQTRALYDLQQWIRKSHDPAGGIVVIPTGGGKTFVAIRFACSDLLSRGYKILWLAHTHHLLEQAYYGFVPKSDDDAHRNGLEIARISEPRAHFAIRVVSGTPGHFPAHTITAGDDVVVGTLQTIVRAYADPRQVGLKHFLDSAGGKLAVVFDEAHHSPAPSYRRLIEDIRAKYPGTVLIGLTATPTYGDERKSGWLKRLFPQGIITQCSPQQLMADSILARPVIEETTTNIEPRFSERDFEKWVSSYQDLPESIIEQLAENRERNAAIVERYVKEKAKYGKTIIFADRWYQCDQMREMLRKRGVRADVIYSHVDGSQATSMARNRRATDENGKVLAAFRRDELDVLINVRMLTEGTDIPDVKTVFLTRQTTSRILLTQMVGRALRGPRFGGTSEAYVVSFIDNWKQAINWATFDQIAEGMADESVPEYGKRPPLQLISIELVRNLSRMLDQGIMFTETPFLSMMPVGWYRVEFDAVAAGSEDTQTVRQLVMVFDREKDDYDRFIKSLKRETLLPFASESVSLEASRVTLEALMSVLPCATEESRVEKTTAIFHILRHMAQAEGEPPPFFPFENRDHHDLDAVAQHFSFDKQLPIVALDESLKAEYARKDRYWRVIYPAYRQFKSQYDACVNGLLERRSSGAPPQKPKPVKVERQKVPEREPSEDVKAQIKARDGYRCLCCGETNKRMLQVDHVAPSYYGGDNSPANLQTLCKLCNELKSVNTLNFHNQTTTLAKPPQFELLPTPPAEKTPEVWEMYVRRSINVFYQCQAVEAVRIGKRGEFFYQWAVSLYVGNDPAWIRPHLKLLRERINAAKEKARQQPIEKIRVWAPGKKEVSG